jgi:hypothetical protein
VDTLIDFRNWAWARHHNPLSWYIRPLVWAFRRRSWLGGATVIGAGTLLEIAWSFRVAGSSAWAIIPPVALGTAVCAGVLWIAYRRVRMRPA